MSSNLDRYERIAPLYDLLDRPLSIAAIARYGLCSSRGLKGRALDAGMGLVEIFSSTQLGPRLLALTSAQPGRRVPPCGERTNRAHFNSQAFGAMTEVVGVLQ